MAKPEIARKVDEVLDRIGLPGIGKRKVEELSGGQKQRVAIARCMVMEPDVLLLDEPLGALDLKLREHMKIELKALQTAFDTTFVYITHDQSEALVMSDQIAVMNEGRFEQVGTGHELYYRPETAFVAGFVGEANRWRGQMSGPTATRWKCPPRPGSRSRRRPRPRPRRRRRGRDLRAPRGDPRGARRGGRRAIRQPDDGTVTTLLFNGAARRMLVRETGGDEIEVTLPQSGEYADLVRGDAVHIGWEGDQANAFAPAAERG